MSLPCRRLAASERIGYVSIGASLQGNSFIVTERNLQSLAPIFGDSAAHWYVHQFPLSVPRLVVEPPLPLA